MAQRINRRTFLGAVGVTAAAVGGQALVAPEAAAQLDLPLVGPIGDGDHMNVMTYNLRVPVDDGWKAWSHRIDHIDWLFHKEQPTIMGTQEAHVWQIVQLMDKIRARFGERYRAVRRGVYADGTGPSNGVVYDDNRLRLDDHGHWWFSDTPNVAGSKGWGNEQPRMMAWLRFHDRRTGRDFVHVNTHLDHQSSDSRNKSAALIKDKIPGFGVPVVVTGDFNAEPGSPVHAKMVDGGTHDSWITTAQRLTQQWNTTNGWSTALRDTGRRIDWIIGTAAVDFRQAGINHWYPHDHLHVASDHWAYQAKLRLT